VSALSFLDIAAADASVSLYPATSSRAVTVGALYVDFLSIVIIISNRQRG
jgi:hypothetical protein